MVVQRASTDRLEKLHRHPRFLFSYFFLNFACKHIDDLFSCCQCSFGSSRVENRFFKKFWTLSGKTVTSLRSASAPTLNLAL